MSVSQAAGSGGAPLVAADSVAPAFSRSCGSCTLCCKVYDVPPVDNKPRGVWCKHCKPGSSKGCGIWLDRPQFCRDFHCHWIKDLSFGEEWKPEKSKMVMNYRSDQNVFSVVVDPGMPGAWLREPYHSGLRRLAARLAEKRHALQISINHDVWIITETRDFHVGAQSEEIQFTWNEKMTLSGAIFYELAGIHVTASEVA
jgi:hypothetical protein